MSKVIIDPRIFFLQMQNPLTVYGVHGQNGRRAV